MPRRIQDFCRRTNSQSPPSLGETVRCVLESLALKHAETVDVLRGVTGSDPGELHIVGGGARNELLCAWTADAAGIPVLAGPEEATLLGNLLVQAIALGEIASVEEARDVVRASFAPTTYEPGSRRPGPRRGSVSPCWRRGRPGGERVSGTIGVLHGIPAPTNRWDEPAAAGLSMIDELVYRSKLLGADRSLANIGGGNTSAKETVRDHVGRESGSSG